MGIFILCGQGDIVLVGLRDYEQGKCDVMHKYTADEARQLKSYGELPGHARINQAPIDMKLGALLGEDDQEELGFDFAEVSFLCMYVRMYGWRGDGTFINVVKLLLKFLLCVQI